MDGVSEELAPFPRLRDRSFPPRGTAISSTRARAPPYPCRWAPIASRRSGRASLSPRVGPRPSALRTAERATAEGKTTLGLHRWLDARVRPRGCARAGRSGRKINEGGSRDVPGIGWDGGREAEVGRDLRQGRAKTDPGALPPSGHSARGYSTGDSRPNANVQAVRFQVSQSALGDRVITRVACFRSGTMEPAAPFGQPPPA